MDNAKKHYVITENSVAAPGVFEMTLYAPGIAAAATPGQFMNLYVPDASMLLPRPIGIADVDTGTGRVTLAYAAAGAGTVAMSRLSEGSEIDALGPLGTGFFDYEGFEPADTFLVGGGAGTGPLRFAARWLKERSAAVRVSAFLGFADRPWRLGAFEALCDDVFIASDTVGAAAYHGNVVGLLSAWERICMRSPQPVGHRNMPGTAPLDDRMSVGVCGCGRGDGKDAGRGADDGIGNGSGGDGKNADGARGPDRAKRGQTLSIVTRLDKDAVLPGREKGPMMPALAAACGPRPMLAAVAGWCEARGLDLRVSMEERMGCGYGACAACTCETKEPAGGKPTHGPKAQAPGQTVRKKICAHGPAFWGDEIVW